MKTRLSIKWIGALVFIAVLMCCVVSLAQPTRTVELYNSLMKVPSKTLLEKGLEYRSTAGKADSAVVCFTILSNRVDDAKTMEDKELCVKAFVHMAYIHYFLFYDYPQAFAHMATADDLTEKWGVKVSELPLYYGLMHGSISQQSNDKKTARKGFDYLRKAFYMAQEQGDAHNANLAYANLLALAHTLSLVDSIKPENEAFMRLANENSDNKYYTRFNSSLYSGLLKIEQGKPAEALQHFDEVLQITPDQERYSRYASGLWQYKAIAHERSQNYEAAIECLKMGIAVEQTHNIKDALVEIYRQMADDAALLNRNEDKYLYQNEYLALKDSVLNYQQIASIDEARFLGDIKKVETELKRVETHNNRLKSYSVVAAIMIIIVLIASAVVIAKNKQLRKRNETLYLKNVEFIQAEETERKLRNRYQRELAELRQQLNPEPLVESSTDSVDDASDDDKPTKYASSNLSTNDKEALAEKIRDVMENSIEIYSENFSAERLAAIIGEKYKYLSQTINEIFGYNFNTLLNNYRIREACRRINDTEHYGNLTLEALSLSVGFKSRSTFVLQFKRVTGLTPSQYLTEAHREE